MHRNKKWHKRSHRDNGSSSSGNQSSSHNRPRPDLLVFGYASRIFHDDERARFFDAGRHMIPWMGDASLLIDRYDCRGHLHDLQSADATRLADGTTVGAELYGDADFEELADEERYRDLWNEQREQTAREKELLESEMEQDYLAATGSETANVGSNSTAKFGAVPFSYAENAKIVEYDKDTFPVESDSEKAVVISPETKAVSVPSIDEKKADEIEVPFVPRDDFEIPSNICLPQFEKINSIIEKTAQFIAEKGSQLEAVIRVKQANNENFSFLNPKDVLHPYYKFLVESVKAGTFKPVEKAPSRPATPPRPAPPESDSDSDDGDYLHPSLLRAHVDRPKPPPLISAVFSGSSPSSNLYSSLIQTVQTSMARSVSSAPPVGPSPEVLSAIDKIVTYIVKNGESFEELIQKRHGPDDAKFGFVHGYHPYHSLYEEKKRASLNAAAIAAAQPRVFTYSPRSNKSFFQRIRDMKHVEGPPAEKPVDPPAKPPPIEVPPPPPPPPPPAVPEEDPRIKELKKKAMEASLRIAQRLKEQASVAAKVTEMVISVKPEPVQTVENRVIVDNREPPLPSVETARKPVQADPGSLLELLQLDRKEVAAPLNGGGHKKRRKRRDSSTSSGDDRDSRRTKADRRSRRSRSRSLSAERRHRKKHRRSRS